MVGRLARRLGHRRWFAAVFSRVLPPLDRLSARVSGHRALLADLVAPALLLRSPGAKDVPLLYAREGLDLIVAATNWGRANHPAWSGRLLRSPSVTVIVGGAEWEVEARHLGPDESARVWPLLVAVWPAFETYRRRTAHEVRVFRLVPRTA